jgi:hypothetical protein
MSGEDVSQDVRLLKVALGRIGHWLLEAAEVGPAAAVSKGLHCRAESWDQAEDPL